MNLHIFLLTLAISMPAGADSVKKWTDEKGNVHYGDKKAAEYAEGTETLEIKDSFNQQSYEEGVVRHKETKELADSLEKERLKEEEKLKAEEARDVKAPPKSGRTSLNPPLRRADAHRNRLPGPGNGGRPVQLPAKKY